MALVIARNCMKELFYSNKVNTFITLAPVLHIKVGTLYQCIDPLSPFGESVRRDSGAGETRVTDAFFSWRMMKCARLADRSTELHNTEFET